jgi:hypothetical protein
LGISNKSATISPPIQEKEKASVFKEELATDPEAGNNQLTNNSGLRISKKKKPIMNGPNYKKWKDFWSNKDWSYCNKEFRTQMTRTGIDPSGQMRQRTALTKKRTIVWNTRT